MHDRAINELYICTGLWWGRHGCYLTVLEPLEGNNFVANS